MTGRPPQLYREGYFAAQASRAEGEVVISPSFSMTAYAGCSIALLLAIAALLLLGQYTRKARLEGVVMPSTGLVKVTARSSGQVIAGLTNEGDVVKAGQPLYRLSGEHFNEQGIGALAAASGALHRQCQLLEQQREQERAATALQQSALTRRRAQLEEELHSAASALTLTQRQAALSASMMARYRQLSAGRYVAEIELQQKGLELAAAQERVENQRQAHLRLQRELAAAIAERETQQRQWQGRDAELARQLHGLRQQQIELDAQEKNALTAPVDGRIVAVLARNGQTVKQHDPLLLMVAEDARLQVELYAPSKAAGFIKPRQRVGLRFASFPYEKFGVQYGRVQAMTRTSLSAGDALQQHPMVWKENEGHYRAIVTLDKATITAYGREEPLRVGMTVTADVELDRRRLYEWLLEPLWSLRGTL